MCRKGAWWHTCYYQGWMFYCSLLKQYLQSTINYNHNGLCCSTHINYLWGIVDMPKLRRYCVKHSVAVKESQVVLWNGTQSNLKSFTCFNAIIFSSFETLWWELDHSPVYLKPSTSSVKRHKEALPLPLSFHVACVSEANPGYYKRNLIFVVIIVILCKFGPAYTILFLKK